MSFSILYVPPKVGYLLGNVLSILARLNILLDFMHEQVYHTSMNRLSREKQVQVIAAMVEGNSINSIVRMTGVHKTTILKLIASLGSACTDYQDRVMRNLK